MSNSMDDETAFMQLVLSNSQSELSPLERGMHALTATEWYKHGESVKSYAEDVHRPRSTVDLEVRAARVADETATRVAVSDLIKSYRNLAEIHAAPKETWPFLVKQMLGQKWTVKDTQEIVSAVRAIAEAIPAEHADYSRAEKRPLESGQSSNKPRKDTSHEASCSGGACPGLQCGAIVNRCGIPLDFGYGVGCSFVPSVRYSVDLPTLNALATSLGGVPLASSPLAISI